VGGWFYDVIIRRKMAESQARAFADRAGKPMLNVGSGTEGSSFAASIFGPSTAGDVNLDSAGSGSCLLAEPGGPACRGDATDLSDWPDKHFGAVVASHIAEHLDDPDAALREWQRVADKVYVVTPRPWWLHAWGQTEHKWMFWPGGRKTRLWR